ncbi:MAG: glycosyl hydrolase 2 galactose-binding domain-containing protein, partial [Flavobacteriales bacterium]
MKKILLFLLVLCVACTNDSCAQTALALQGTWQCLDSVEINAPGRLPGSLHNALLIEGIIADPFVGTNEDSIQWVSQMDWTFTSHAFEASEVDLNSKFLEIDRVLTYSVWSINGVNIGTTDNAFHMWKFDLKSALKPTGNIVQINFESPHKRAKSIISNASHPLPGDALRAVHRSPQFAFGWDWAMSLLDNSVGSMNIEQSSTKHPLQIKKLDVITDRIDSGTATGRVRWEIEGESDEKLMLRWALTNPEGQVVAAGKPKHGKGLVEVPFEIKNADLWWTHDLGTPAMHTLEVVAVGQGKLMGREKIEVGLRTLRLDTSEDKRGANFKWILNNVPL